MKSYIPLQHILPEGTWPESLLQSDSEAYLTNLGVEYYNELGAVDNYNIFIQLKLFSDLSFDLPFLDGLSFHLKQKDNEEDNLIEIELKGDLSDIEDPDFDIINKVNLDLSILSSVFYLKISRELLIPVEKVEQEGKVTFEDTGEEVLVAIPFSLRVQRLDEQWNMEFEGGPGQEFKLPLARINGTPFVIETEKLIFNFSGSGQRPKDTAENWKGLYIQQAKLFIENILNDPIQLTDFGIGSGGFFGQFASPFPLTFNENNTPKFTGPLTNQLLGFEAGFSSLEISFFENVPTQFNLAAQIYIPYFDDPIGLTIGWENDDFSFSLTSYDRAYIDENCIAFQWTAEDMSALSSRFAPGFLDNLQGKDVAAIFRLIRGDGGNIQEVRLDVDLNQESSNNVFNFDIPGLAFEVPKDLQLSLVLQNTSDNGILPHNAFVIARLKNEDNITISSNFAWTRDAEREIQNDGSDTPPADAPLLAFSLKATENTAISLFKYDLKDPGLPVFLRRPKIMTTGENGEKQEQSLPALKLPEPNEEPDEYLCAYFPIETDNLSGTGLNPTFNFNLDKLEFPFLKNKKQEGSSNSSGIEQFVNIQKKEGGVDINLSDSTIKCPLAIEFKIGSIAFTSGVDLGFNFEKFAFEVNHDGGIELYLDEQEKETPDFLGLDWLFRGEKKIKNDKEVYHFFTIVTKNYHYQIKMAEEASLELSYTKASKDPIVFSVSDFVISGKGISLTAEVTDRPARLNGIDTKFTFGGTRFQIVENKIKDFTLSGSGPLPSVQVPGSGKASPMARTPIWRSCSCQTQRS